MGGKRECKEWVGAPETILRTAFYETVRQRIGLLQKKRCHLGTTKHSKGGYLKPNTLPK
eukprot:SAG11_NODE_744_length_7406_cov_2.773231_3_plen_59_part_00